MYTNSIICKIYKHIKIWKYFLKRVESLKSFLLIFYNSIEMIEIITEILLAADDCINLDILAKEWQEGDTVILYFSIFALSLEKAILYNYFIKAALKLVKS